MGGQVVTLLVEVVISNQGKAVRRYRELNRKYWGVAVMGVVCLAPDWLKIERRAGTES
jgi:hypothetical protein